MAFERILVATDFSEGSLSAARLARTLASPGAIYEVVHVVPPTAPFPYRVPMDSTVIEDARDRMQRDVEGHLSRFVADADLPVDTPARMIEGGVGRAVAAAAERLRADLVALGARGHSRIERLLLGSKARSVLHRAHASVLVARGGSREAGPPERVVVATDFSTAAEAAGRVAREIAETTGGELIALHVADPTPFGSVLDLPEGVPGPMMLQHVNRGWLERTTGDALEHFNAEKLGGIARETISYGEPVEETLGVIERERVDLLVVGTHGPGAIERALLGSVAESLAERAPCSVLVVKRADAD